MLPSSGGQLLGPGWRCCWRCVWVRSGVPIRPLSPLCAATGAKFPSDVAAPQLRLPAAALSPAFAENTSAIPRET